MNAKLIVFDLDGTLLNTIDDLANAVNYAMEKLHCPTHPVAVVQQMVGNGLEKLMTRALPSDKQHLLPQALELFTENYSVHCEDNTRPYDGVLQMLDDLHKSGVEIGVFSNKPHAQVQTLCKNHFGDLVHYALGTFVGQAKKPDPFGVFEILKRSGKSASEAVYCGDSEVDVQTAQNAHLPCISVSWGFKTRDFLLANGATCIIDSPNQMQIALKNL